jgi:hypothetical protein
MQACSRWGISNWDSGHTLLCAAVGLLGRVAWTGRGTGGGVSTLFYPAVGCSTVWHG